MHNGRLEAWGRCTSDAKELTAFVRQVCALSITVVKTAYTEKKTH